MIGATGSYYAESEDGFNSISFNPSNFYGMEGYAMPLITYSYQTKAVSVFGTIQEVEIEDTYTLVEAQMENIDKDSEGQMVDFDDKYAVKNAMIQNISSEDKKKQHKVVLEDDYKIEDYGKLYSAPGSSSQTNFVEFEDRYNDADNQMVNSIKATTSYKNFDLRDLEKEKQELASLKRINKDIEFEDFI